MSTQTSTRTRTTILWIAGIAGASALLVGGAFFALYAFNPMGDEWVCSDGEAPAGTDGFYNQCFTEGSKLPTGFSWDPFGNRPMSYNCDKDGWVAIERSVVREGATVDEDDCVRAGTDLSDGWHVNKNH